MPKSWAFSKATTGCGSKTTTGKFRQVADLYYGISKGVINLEHQRRFPELDQADKGFDLCGCNCLVTTGKGYQDRISGTSYLRGPTPVKIYKATPENSPFGNPVPGATTTETRSSTTHRIRA